MEDTSTDLKSSGDATPSVNPYIPIKFAEYSEQMKATIKKTITFKLKKAANDLQPWQSKVGGQPYLPLTKNIPTSKDGSPLSFLAQINFAEIPPMPDYPSKGIVEFYIDGTDELMGLNYDNFTDQSGFRVLYFDAIETCGEIKHHIYPREEHIKNNAMQFPFSVDESYSMSDFVIENQYMSAGDYRFHANILPEDIDFDIIYEYEDTFPAEGNRIGGYPEFKQGDPRSDNDSLLGYELLFQLGSDTEISWGDMGVGGFFIRPEDLRNCDFSKVAYNWDSC